VTWSYIQDNVLQKWPRWPSPFKGMVSRIDVLACEHSWLAMVELVGAETFDWVWTNNVPQFTEILRKTVTGSYRCGFFGLPEQKSPLDVLWQTSEETNQFGVPHLPLSRVVGQILEPATTGLFYWWLAETAWDGLSRWMSVITAQQLCGTDWADIIWHQDDQVASPGTYVNASVVGYGAYVDRHPSWGAPSAGTVTIPGPAHIRVTAAIKALDTGGHVHSLHVWLNIGGQRYGETTIPDNPDSSQNSVLLDASGDFLLNTSCSVGFSCVVTGTAGTFSVLSVTPFCVSQQPINPPPGQCASFLIA